MRVPDSLEPLPVLKALIVAETVELVPDPHGDQLRIKPVSWQLRESTPDSPVETERASRRHHYRLRSPLMSSTEWAPGETMTAACEAYGRALQNKPDPEPIHRPPAPGCSCGFYGWYPWAETRWPGYTPFASEELVNVDPRPHPLLSEITTWFGYRLITGKQPWESTMFDITYTAMVIGVVMVEGEVSLGQAGVKAERATLVDIVDPESVPIPPMRTWPIILSAMTLYPMAELAAKVKVDKARELLAFNTNLALKATRRPLITYGEAVTATQAAWGERGTRLKRSNTIV